MTLDIVEKMARKELRLANIRPETLVLVENETQAFVVAKYLLKKIFPRQEIPIGSTGIVPVSRDELNAGFLTTFLEDRSDEKKHCFLSTISYKELRAYAEKNNLKLRELILDEQEKLAHELLSQLEVSQSQTMASLRKSADVLSKSYENKKESYKKGS